MNLRRLQDSSCYEHLLLSNPDVKYLLLSTDKDFTPSQKGFDNFLRALQSLSNLEQLHMDFRFASLPYKKFDTTVLRNVLLKNPRLANLDINFGDSLANCNEWEPVPWIEKLDLHGAKITAGVLQLLQHCPNITSLAVALHANCSWGDVYEALGGAGGGAKLICLEFHRPRVNYTSDRVMMYGSNSIALRILEATTSLVKLTLPFDAFVVDSCTAIIDHCSNTLQYLTLDIDKMKMATVFSINKLLRSCPQLRHLAIHGKDYSHGWFHLFEPQWNALKLESFIFEMHFEHKAIDFADDVHNLEALDECFSFYVNLLQEDYLTFDKEVQMNGHSKLSDTGFEFVQVRDVYNIGLEMGLDNPAVDKLLGALERHFEHERQYIASIEESGWYVCKDYDKRSVTVDLQRFRGLIFEAASSLPSLKKIHINADYVRF